MKGVRVRISFTPVSTLTNIVLTTDALVHTTDRVRWLIIAPTNGIYIYVYGSNMYFNEYLPIDMQQ